MCSISIEASRCEVSSTLLVAAVSQEGIDGSASGFALLLFPASKVAN